MVIFISESTVPFANRTSVPFDLQHRSNSTEVLLAKGTVPCDMVLDPLAPISIHTCTYICMYYTE